MSLLDQRMARKECRRRNGVGGAIRADRHFAQCAETRTREDRSEMNELFPVDVFLSHSSRDKAHVRATAERLRADGLQKEQRVTTPR